MEQDTVRPRIAPRSRTRWAGGEFGRNGREAAGFAVWFAKQRSPTANGRNCKYSTMKAFAHLSPTVPAVFIAAIGIALSVFLLPGAWVQGEPSPLVAVVGGAAGRVAADLRLPSTSALAPSPQGRFAQLASRLPSMHRGGKERPRRTGYSATLGWGRGQTPPLPSRRLRPPLPTLVTTSGPPAPGHARGHLAAHSHGLRRPSERKRPGKGTERRSGARASTTTDSPGHAKQAPTVTLCACAPSGQHHETGTRGQEIRRVASGRLRLVAGSCFSLSSSPSPSDVWRCSQARAQQR